MLEAIRGSACPLQAASSPLDSISWLSLSSGVFRLHARRGQVQGGRAGLVPESRKVREGSGDVAPRSPSAAASLPLARSTDYGRLCRSSDGSSLQSSTDLVRDHQSLAR